MLLEEYLQKIQNEEPVNEIGYQAAMVGLTAGMLAVSAFDAFKSFMTKAGRQCFGLDGKDKSICMTKMRIEGTRKLMAELEKRKTICAKARNPKKCVDQMNKKIMKQKERLDMYNTQMKALRM